MAGEEEIPEESGEVPAPPPTPLGPPAPSPAPAAEAIKAEAEPLAEKAAAGAALGGEIGAGAVAAQAGIEMLQQAAASPTGSIHEFQTQGAGGGGTDHTGAAVLAALRKIGGTRSRL